MTGDDMAHIRGFLCVRPCSCSGGYPTYELGFEEAPQAGPTQAKPIQTGCQCERQVWPILHEHAHSQATGRPAVRRLVAFPITVPADKKPTLTRKEPGEFSRGSVIPGLPGSRCRVPRDVDAHCELLRLVPAVELEECAVLAAALLLLIEQR